MFSFEDKIKRVEKPLLIELCNLCGVPREYYNAENFIRDTEKDFDREVDFKLYSRNFREYRCEVKLMGSGNPESADAVIARDSDIFIADTLSTQNKNQLNQFGISWIELKNHDNADIISQFKEILLRLDIPCFKN